MKGAHSAVASAVLMAEHWAAKRAGKWAAKSVDATVGHWAKNSADSTVVWWAVQSAVAWAVA
jgi:hypothetical protein